MVITKPLSDLVTNLSEKLKPEDLSSLLDASKDDIDGVDEKELENLSSNAQWFQWLCDKLLLTCDDLSFIEHVFELCCRPDLLKTVLEYRIKNLNIDAQVDELPARTLSRVSSAKKYIASQLDSPERVVRSDLKLSEPPKTRKKSIAS